MTTHPPFPVNAPTSSTPTTPTTPTRADESATRPSVVERIRALAGRPALLGTLLLVAALAVVWGTMLFSASQPRTLDQKATAVEGQLLLPGGDGETLTNGAGPQADLMRQVIHEKLAAGASEQQVLAYMEQHYGEGILAQPPFDGFTLLIWIVPGVMLLLGVGVAIVGVREWRPARVVGAATKAPTQTRRVPARPIDNVGTTSDEHMSEAERAELRVMLARELAAEEGLPPRAPQHDAGGEGEGA